MSPTIGNWSPKTYQDAASFVPNKLAAEIVRWLDPQEDDVILDVGCGGGNFRLESRLGFGAYACVMWTRQLSIPFLLQTGVLDIAFARVLARGNGRLHGIDYSPAMIAEAKAAAEAAGLADRCTFEVLDAATLDADASLPRQTYTKAFSHAALHWILREPATRTAVFRGVRDALAPNGTFAFELGGVSNMANMRAALLGAVGRRVGLARALEADPWFFPDEEWVRETLERTVGGWRVERAERAWCPVRVDRDGLERWVRLMGRTWFDAVPDDQREECAREVVSLLEFLCRKHGGAYELTHIGLRVLARKVAEPGLSAEVENS